MMLDNSLDGVSSSAASCRLVRAMVRAGRLLCALSPFTGARVSAPHCPRSAARLKKHKGRRAALAASGMGEKRGTVQHWPHETQLHWHLIFSWAYTMHTLEP